MSYKLRGTKVYYYGNPELEALTVLESKLQQTQSYHELLKEATGSVFEDPEFPHTDESVGDIDALLDTANPEIAEMVKGWKAEGWNGSTTWVRVADLCTAIYGSDYKCALKCGEGDEICGRMDIQQGLTGDCWFVCSVSAVSMVKDLIDMVVPDDNINNAGGLYHFRFWCQGAWVDIVVDDFIPTYKVGSTYNIVGSNFFVSNKEAEFWPVLVEKAFAKLNGSYKNIAGNIPMYGLEALTGGYGEAFSLQESVPANLFEGILKWMNKDCINAAGTSTTANGITGGHAYSITGAVELKVTEESGETTVVEALRIRNPWGSSEWTGDWSDDSPLWNKVSAEQKASIKFHHKDDGEFWISFADFKTHFSDISSCAYLTVEMHDKLTQPDSPLKVSQYYDSWSNENNTTGGWDAPAKNPHYPVVVGTVDSETTTIMIVSLTVIEKLYVQLPEDHVVGIRVFEATGDEDVFDDDFLLAVKT